MGRPTARVAGIGGAMRANDACVYGLKHATRRVEWTIGIEVECGRIREDAGDVRLIDSGDFQFAIEKAASSKRALARGVGEAAVREIGNDGRIIERNDSDFLQGHGNAKTDAVIVSAIFGLKGVGTDFRRIADGNVQRIGIGTAAA